MFLIETKHGTFNKVEISEKGIKIYNYRNSELILWEDISSIRLLCREFDIRNGLDERYYGIYYTRDNEECKEMISYNMETEKELRKYYKKKYRKKLYSYWILYNKISNMKQHFVYTIKFVRVRARIKQEESMTDKKGLYYLVNEYLKGNNKTKILRGFFMSSIIKTQVILN